MTDFQKALIAAVDEACKEAFREGMQGVRQEIDSLRKELASQSEAQ